ncbi:hypothetical protein EV121DRAFT_284611 [Schizophyllum commune]
MAGRNGAQITIQRDPLTGKFPCPCGAPKHARRESNKMRQLCIAANHPGPNDNTVAAEAATDDEDASVPTPDKPLKRRRRPSRKRPASGSPSPVESEEENERRRGKRRAPSPQSSDGDNEIVIVKGPVFRPGACLTGITARPETRITAYGGVEQASGSQQAAAQNATVHDQIERQVRRLKDLNERAREQYLESLEEERFVFIQAADQTQEITRRLRNLLKKQL